LGKVEVIPNATSSRYGQSEVLCAQVKALPLNVQDAETVV